MHYAWRVLQVCLPACHLLLTRALHWFATQADNEEEVDVMIRLSTSPVAVVNAARTQLQQLRHDLNMRAFRMLEGHIRSACGQGSATAAAGHKTRFL